MSKCNCKIDTKKIDKLISKYKADSSSLIMVLQDINREFRYIPKEAMARVSEKLHVPLSKVYSVATFYSVFSLKPRGETLLRVCMGTACHIKGASVLLENLENQLKIKSGQTTKDGKFTLETVNCVGACSLAPLVVENEKYHGNTKPNRIRAMIKGKK